MSDSLLQIKNLSLGFVIKEKLYKAINDVSFDFKKGKIHAIVGESGCGKSITMMSILKLLPKSARILDGRILFEGKNLLELKEDEMQKIRGKKIAFIPQDPMTSLNPLYTIENQLLEIILLHNDISKKEAYELALETVKNTGIIDPEKVMKSYPHELSGGMMQRVIISMALATDAEIIIADEPTTALDVTIQAQILRLLDDIRKRGKTIILITHNLGIVSEYADDVYVMYLGEIVEYSASDKLFKNPKHPYTKALINALPNDKNKKLENIKGQPSPITEVIEGCKFHPRCNYRIENCGKIHPQNKIFDDKTSVLCHLYTCK